jgi:large subunit ribosomal protein L9
MKVILTQEVKGKGHEGDVVDVARGYAVNYLLPRKMAIEASTGNLKQLAARMANIQKRNDERRSEAEGVAGAANGRTVVIEAKAGDEGKLFGSVTTLMIEEAIAAQLDVDVDHRRMDLRRPIKALGDYPVVVSVYGEVKAEVLVRVVGEGGVTAAATVEAPAVAEATPDSNEADVDAVDAEAEAESPEAVEAEEPSDEDEPEADQD